MTTQNRNKPRGVEQARRIMIGVAWGLAPVLFVGWLASDVEAPMGAWARALGIFQRVLMLALASSIVASAGLFGMRLLRWMRVAPESLFARFVLGAGLGLGALALVTLAFGGAGLIGPPFAACVFGAMLLAGIFELRDFGRWVRRTERPRFPRLAALELALVFGMLLALVFQTLLAFNLPTDYDACEYHMAAPWRWAQIGRIDWVEGNVYTNLPMNCEMLYLYSLALVGHSGPWPQAADMSLNVGSGWERLCLGVHLGVVMNLMTALLATAAVFVLARRFFSRRAALVAAALFLTMPWTMIATTINIYNEILLAAWATLAVYALKEFAETRAVRWLVLSAVFAGLAAGVKYTALGFFPPVLAIAAVVVLWKSSWLKRIGAGVLAPAIVFVVVSPWFVKNAAFTGNPVFPFGYNWFGGRDWSEELDWKWYAGNFKAAGADQAGNLLVATWQRIVWPKHQWGSAAIALFALLALVAWRQRAVRWLWILLVLWTLLWYFGTHRVDRFWLPFAGVAAALAGCGFAAVERKHLRRALTALLFLGLGWQLYVCGLNFAASAAGNYDVLTGNGEALARSYDLIPLVDYLGVMDAFAQRGGQGFSHPAGPRVLLFGEARGLYLPPNIVCSTVFNREVFTATIGDIHEPERVRERLLKANVGIVFVNWMEVERLRKTYTLVGSDGRTVPGLPPISQADFQKLVDAGVLMEVSIEKLVETIARAPLPWLGDDSARVKSRPGVPGESQRKARRLVIYMVTPAAQMKEIVY